MGISADRLWFWAISQHVSFLLWGFFFQMLQDAQRGKAACRRVVREGEAVVGQVGV